eukprot:TRINITY_DN2653_c0_g1_i1.p1 TRINITY_DN2653_c0_g1~~TRINITY_DN2653_c0_g1_i1.p1  ORF type:complete len:613 (+),score=128.35 TRINITY_DN2653_c0_g1_i1:196-2034(+)
MTCANTIWPMKSSLDSLVSGLNSFTHTSGIPLVEFCATTNYVNLPFSDEINDDVVSNLWQNPLPLECGPATSVDFQQKTIETIHLRDALPIHVPVITSNTTIKTTTNARIKPTIKATATKKATTNTTIKPTKATATKATIKTTTNARIKPTIKATATKATTNATIKPTKAIATKATIKATTNSTSKIATKATTKAVPTRELMKDPTTETRKIITHTKLTPTKVPTKVSSSLEKNMETLSGEKMDSVMIVSSMGPAQGSPKIAAFDMDWTLIAPTSGGKFPRSRFDWKWLFPNVPEKLRQLHEQGYKIVIISNQAGISSAKSNEEAVVGKIHDLSRSANVPIQAFIATRKDHYRKPNVNIWECVKKNNQGIEIDLTQSFFVGDAAGRIMKKDISCDDRKFAFNLGLRFYTESEFFQDLSEKEPFGWCGFDPHLYLSETRNLQENPDIHFYQILGQTQEMILCVGPPGSGKSTFSRTYFGGSKYVIVNQDTLKTFSACLDTASRALRDGFSVVIDNTNPSKQKRGVWISLAQSIGVPVKVLFFRTDVDLSYHLNLMRWKLSNNSIPPVPTIAYAIFKKQFEAPTKEEGIQDIIDIPFVPSFKNSEEEKIFRQYS